MRIFVFVVFILLLLSCSKKAKDEAKFTDAEIALLMLDSTQMVYVRTDSIKKVELNDFLKRRVFNFGEILNNISIIPLETTDKSLISNIEDILVTDSNIYISDSYQGGSVPIFDDRGNFIKRLNRGQGPDEILGLKNFAFDKKKNELIVFHSHFFSYFTPNGEFKRRVKIPLNAYSFAVTPSGYLFYSINGMDNRHLNLSAEYQLLITDKSFKLKSVGLSYRLSENINLEGSTHYLALNNNIINFTSKFNDTIYQYIDDNTIQAKEILNISDHEIPTQLLRENSENLISNLHHNNYFFFLGEYADNNTHEYFRISNFYNKTYTHVFRDKVTGICFGGTDISVDRSLFPPLGLPISSRGSSFISYFLPGDEYMKLLTNKRIPKKMVEKLKKLTEDNNPVLIFYDLKPFK